MDATWSDARWMSARPNRPRSTPRVRRRVGTTSVSNAQSAHRGQPGCSLFLNVRLWEREDRYRSRSMPRSNEQHCDDASATRASACNPPLSTALQWTGAAPYVLPRLSLMRYDRSPILRERVACGGTNSSEFFAFDTSQTEQQSWTDGGGVEEQRRTFSPKAQREARSDSLS